MLTSIAELTLNADKAGLFLPNIFSNGHKDYAAETQTLFNEHAFRDFINTSSVGIWNFAPDHPISVELPEQEQIDLFFEAKCRACNYAYARMIDADPEDLIGMKLSDILPRTEENISYFKNFIHNGFRLQNGISHEITPQGKEKYFSNSFIGIVQEGFLTTAWGTQVDVTESYRNEAGLQESKRRLSTIIDNLPGIAYRCVNDSNWTMLFLSKKFDQVTGYKAEDCIDNARLSYSDIMYPEDREPVWIAIQRAMKDELPYQIEYRIQSRDGQIKWVWEQGRAVGNNEKGQAILEGLIMDITQRKFAELRTEIMHNIALAFNSTRDLGELIDVIQKDLGRAVKTTNFMLALYDPEKDQFSLSYMKDEKDHFDTFPVGKTISSLVIRKNKSLLLKGPEIDELERRGEIERFGSPARSWLGVPLRVKGKVMGIIVLQDYDSEYAINRYTQELLEFISTQIAGTLLKKQAEEEISKLLQSVEQSPNSIVITDVQGKIEYANQKFFYITGYSDQEVVGNLPNILNPEFNSEENISEIWDFIKAGHDWHGEFYNRRKNGEFYWELASITSVRNTRGVVSHVVYTKEDITRRKEIERDLVKAKELAEESDKLKTAFLANMSHEIRTPMNAIIGFTEMLGSEEYSDDEEEKFIDLILENGRKLLNIIDDIIDIAKIEAGQLSISKRNCSANKILYDNFYTFKQLKTKLNKEQIELKAKQFIPDENLLFLSDQQRINQVISNLMSNALKYTLEGLIELGYQLVNEEGRTYVDFYVRDTGVGIPEGKSEVIFDRFRQINEDHTRSIGGTGLGLAISRNIARLMGGDIRVESKLEEGSTFHFLIPYEKLTEKDIAAPRLVVKKPDKPDWSEKTVLIAEDEDSNFKLLEVMLRKSRVDIKRAYNGKQAVEYVKGGKPVDLILMDIRMPVMDGYDATEIIKSFKPGIPVVIQTAFALAGDRENSLESGSDDYLSKPIKATELYQILKKYLG
ncbi:MAG: PAS domain S-box protein [Bacteroidales bacterium]